MVMLTPADFPFAVGEDVARRILAVARTIAPCLDSLPDESEEKKTAIAILTAVGAEVVARGSRQVASQRIGPAAVVYRDVGSAFTDDDRSALRGLCAAATRAPGDPVGSFPKPSRSLERMWPEDC